MKKSENTAHIRFKDYVRYWIKFEPEHVPFFLAAHIGRLVDRVEKLERQVRGLKARKRK